MNPLTANELRRAFLQFFSDRGHTVVPSASLIPHDPDLLFTVAGMVPFKPYFLGEEQPIYTRATTVQKCVRVNGKDDDLEEVGRDHSHLSFFEMLGNFSFGDYFKSEAIPMAWDMVTNLFGIDPDQMWITVHSDDDEADAAVGRAGRCAARAHPAAGGQLVGPSRRSAGALRPQLRDLRRPGRALRRRRRPGPRQRGPVPRDLEPRVHAVQPRSRRCGHRAAEEEHRHRRRPRAHPRRAAGQGLGVGHRRAGPARRVGPVGHRSGARSVRRRRRVAADPGRARPHDELPRQRRRVPVQRGSRLRAAPHHPPGRAPRLPARRRRPRHARARRHHGRGHGRGLPGPGQEPRLRAQRGGSRRGALPPDAQAGHRHPRARARRGAPKADVCRGPRPSCCTTPTASPSS